MWKNAKWWINVWNAALTETWGPQSCWHGCFGRLEKRKCNIQLLSTGNIRSLITIWFHAQSNWFSAAIISWQGCALGALFFKKTVVLLRARCQLCGSSYLEAKTTASKRKLTYEVILHKHKTWVDLFLYFIFMGFGHQGKTLWMCGERWREEKWEEKRKTSLVVFLGVLLVGRSQGALAGRRQGLWGVLARTGGWESESAAEKNIKKKKDRKMDREEEMQCCTILKRWEIKMRNRERLEWGEREEKKQSEHVCSSEIKHCAWVQTQGTDDASSLGIRFKSRSSSCGCTHVLHMYINLSSNSYMHTDLLYVYAHIHSS